MVAEKPNAASRAKKQGGAKEADETKSQKAKKADEAKNQKAKKTSGAKSQKAEGPEARLSSSKTIEERMKEVREDDVRKEVERRSRGEEKYYHRREEQARNLEAKKIAFDLEKKNNSQIILFRSTHGFWKMGGVSALIFYYQVSKQIGWRYVNLRSDTDFDLKFADGVVSISNLSALETAFEKNKIKLGEERGCLRLYNLNFEIKPSLIKEMRDNKRLLEERANRNVVPKVLHPEIFGRCKKLLADFRVRFLQMKEYDRDFIGLDSMGRLRQVLELEIAVSNGSISLADGYAKISKLLGFFLRDTEIMSAAEIITLPRVVALQDQTIDLRRMIDKELQREGEAA